MIEIITIRCFQCRKIVDKARAQRDEAACGFRFTVECHGETDSCLITDYFLAHADAGALKDMEGVAFGPKGEALPLRPKQIEAPR